MARRKPQNNNTTAQKASKTVENNETQRFWEERIALAVKAREKWASEFKEEMSWNYFEGKQNPGVPVRDFIANNKIFSQMQVILPSLYSVDPYYYVRLERSFSPAGKFMAPEQIAERTAEYDRRGKIRQAYLNYLKKPLELKKKARLCIQDAFPSYGVMKIHYKADNIENPNAGEVMKDENNEPIIDENGDELLHPELIPTNERYQLTRVVPEDFGWDSEAGTTEDKWNFIWERQTLTFADAKKDTRFDKKALESINRMIDKRYNGKKSERRRDEDETFTSYEICDLRNEKFLIIAEGADSPLIDERSLPPGIIDHPYAILMFVNRHKSPYPIPPISQAVDPQKEFNLARSDILKHRKRFNRKYAATEAVDKNELPKLASGDDGTVILVPSMPAEAHIAPIRDAPLDQTRYMEVAALNRDIVEVLGASDQSRGIANSDSATESALLDKHQGKREGDKLSIIADWLTVIARKLDYLVQTHINRDEAVRVIGPEGELFELVRQEDYDEIEGEFEYSVNVGSTQPQLPEVDRVHFNGLLGMLASAPWMMTAPGFMKKVGEMHHIEDEVMLEGLKNAALNWIQLQAQGANGGGESGPVSASGVPQANPQTFQGGPQGAVRGGTNNGGGSPQLASVKAG